MKCPTCNHTLRTGVHNQFWCENCFYTTGPDTVSTPQPVHNHAVKKLLRSKKALLALFAIILLGIGGLAGYQNVHAQNLVKKANSLETAGEYTKASPFFKAADGIFLLPSTRQQLTHEITQNNLWQKYDSDRQTAEQLITKQQYDAALALLQKIGKDFPGYSKVTSDIQLATSKKIVPQTTANKPQATTPTTPKVRVGTPAPKTPKRFTSTAAASSLAAATNVAQAQQALQTFLDQYGLIAQITTVSPSSYVSQHASYTILTGGDLAALKAYGALFIDEWAKYPTTWVSNSNLKSIVIVKGLVVDSTHRAAMPDPVGHAMYYDAGFGGDYAREVVHHEYDHVIEYNYFGSWNHSDPTWQSYNPPGFSYGNGGASCYQPGNTCLTGSHPVSGFVTGYAASAIEEDKAELFAYLMTNTYYHQLKGWLASDSYLNNKVTAYKQFIASHSAQMSGDYFDSINP